MKIYPLGQSGFIYNAHNTYICIDPYLSNSVEELMGCQYKRKVPVFSNKAILSSIDYILITHNHLDHCDPETLKELLNHSLTPKIIGTIEVINFLKDIGFDSTRLLLCNCDSWTNITNEVKIIGTIAAHPQISVDKNGNYSNVGYIIDFNGSKIYHSGDTSLVDEVIEDVNSKGPIHAAFIPVNERNYLREKEGIVGNMGVRDALHFASILGVKYFVPMHYDMFQPNSVHESEIEIVHQNSNSNFQLLFKPKYINLSEIRYSIIIRTLNEERHLADLLRSIQTQKGISGGVEVVIVDSGSTDRTVNIAKEFNCRIVYIKKKDFSFGRSLNVGCSEANGEYLAITSGHCVPQNEYWLSELCKPLAVGQADYSYGKQIGGVHTKLSEHRIFDKYYTDTSRIQKKDFFCNNANSAITKETWQKYKFDEELTGLEDMELGNRLIADGGAIAYVAEAPVYHYHYESYAQVRRRFEREAIALRRIMPQLHVTKLDSFRYIICSVFRDCISKHSKRSILVKFIDSVFYRFNQDYGAWKGHAYHRKRTAKEKEMYFYPNKLVG